MGRKEPCQNKHTSPDIAGRDNINVELLPKDTIKDNIVSKLFVGQMEARRKYSPYKGKWTEEKFAECVMDYFVYSSENNIKVCKPGICLWLGCTSQTYDTWNKGNKDYGYKSEIIKQADLFMQAVYVSRIESYPTGNAFMLKTSHGYIDASKLDITTHANDVNLSEADINDAIKRLGFTEQNTSIE